MPDNNTQAVVEDANVSSVAGSEATDARKDDASLDDLLKEYDQKTQPVETQKPSTQSTAPNPLEDRLAQLERQIWETKHTEEVNKTVSKLIGDTGISRKIAKGWLEETARENPSVTQAFLNRDKDPASWNRIAGALGKQFSEEFKPSNIDQRVTDDKEAVTAALKGSSTKAPEDKMPNYSGMSDSEYRESVEKKYGYNPI